MVDYQERELRVRRLEKVDVVTLEIIFKNNEKEVKFWFETSEKAVLFWIKFIA